MKEEIHPKYFPKAIATCACGAEFEIASTKEKIRLDICAKCHPFFTGTQKLVDSEGRVDRFKKRYKKAAEVTAEKPKKQKPAPRKPAKKKKT